MPISERVAKKNICASKCSAELIAVGSELTSGHTVNTNAAYLARRLQELGILCTGQTAVPDDPARIEECLTRAIRGAELVVVTGGLGPTVDDITMAVIAQATGRPLTRSSRVAQRIRAFYRLHHRHIARLALRQADLPRGAVALPNPLGTAPGVWLALERTVVVALPGVPQEMRAIMEGSVLPRLARWRGRAVIVTRTVRTVGLVELEIEAVLRTLALPADVEVGLYPQMQAVDVRFTVCGLPRQKALRLVARLERALRRRLGHAVYGIDGQMLEEVVGQALVRRRATVAIAESCTGGLVSDRMTNVPGSSRYVVMSVVAYQNRVKQALLGVSQAQLIRDGAVSVSVARAMAERVRRLANVDVGLALTGIAGPTGGTPTKPVGLVYMALADAHATRVKQCQFHGDRQAIKYQAAQIALEWLRQWAIGLETRNNKKQGVRSAKFEVKS